MRKMILLSLLFSNSLLLCAQDEVKKSTIPSSPAFSILDFEPTAVMRPTSNKDLATDVLNAFDKDGKLLMNLGLEVSPYWLQSRPFLTREKYLNPDPAQAFLQSFSLSAATVKDSASGDNRFGAGFRFKLINGKPVPDLKDAESELKDIQTIQSDIALVKSLSGTVIKSVKEAVDFIESTMKKQAFSPAAINNVISNAEGIARSFNDDKQGIDSFADALNNSMNDAKGEPLKKVATLTKQRLGFILELAGATSYNMSSTSNIEKIGVWVNASNYVSSSDLFTLTTRYMYLNRDTLVSNFDAGLAYVKKGSTYNISVEYMLRWYSSQIPDFDINGNRIKRLEADFSYRLAIQGAYIITEQLSINISFGKDFSQPFIGGDSYFSILGLNYSIFNKERVKL